MKRIAIFGGTFNPIHNGHLNLCRQCKELLGFDNIYLMPTNLPPHKRAHHLASNEDRLAMCRLAVQGEPEFLVSDLEMRRPGPSYTVITVEHLHECHPDWELYWILGSDMLLSFHQWYRWKDILSLSHLVAGAREPQELNRMEQYRQNTLMGSTRVHILPISVMPMSSTQVRAAIRSGESVSEQLPPLVEQYIRDRGLYQTVKQGGFSNEP